MKYICFLAAFWIMFSSCNQNPKHPQAGLVSQERSIEMDEQSILQFADSIDHILNTLDKKVSLVYDNKDKTIFVEQYSRYEKPVLYIEHADEAAVVKVWRKYYFKKDSLIFITEHTAETTAGAGLLLKDTQSYLRNNTLFKVRTRTAGNESELKTMVFKDLSGHETESVDYREMVKTLQSAIGENNEFEMVFDHLANYSNAAYIVLKSKEQNNYTSNILIREKDTFIDSLATMAPLFKDKKLNFKWKVEDKQAIYVPGDTAKETSASGLKR